MPINYLRYRSDNPDIEQVQDSVEMTFDEVSKVPILNGNLLEDIDVLTAPRRYPHGLGRPFKGFIVVDKTSDVRVFRGDLDVDTSVFIPLQGTATATVKVWVF